MRTPLLLTVSISFTLVACLGSADEPAASRSQDVVAVVDAGPAVDASATSDAADASAPAVPTYAEVAPLIAAHCGTCHHSALATLAKVNAHKDDMIQVLEQHVMPRNDPFWSDTPDGQALLTFLRESPELK